MSRREIARGWVTVDAPRRQRAWGIGIALIGVLAFPVVLVFTQSSPRLSLETSLAGLLGSGILFFAGLAVAASAGRSLEARAKRSPAVFYDYGTHAEISSEDHGALSFPRGSVRGGYYLAPRRQVILHAPGDVRVAMTVDDDDDGHRVLAALGLVDGATVLELSPQERGPRAVEGCLSGVAGLLTALLAAGASAVLFSGIFNARSIGHHWIVLPVLSCALVPVLFTVRWVAGFGAPLLVVLGNDGILFTGKSQIYIPYADIAAVEACDDAVVIRRRVGNDLFVRTAEPEMLATSLCAKLDEEIPESSRLPSLERGELSLEEWRAHLHAIGAATPRYRIGYVDGDRLASIVEDPSAPLDERVGAAYVIASRQDPELIARVRSAAEASAHPTLRAALGRAAEGAIEEQALEEASAILSARFASPVRTMHGSSGASKPDLD